MDRSAIDYLKYLESEDEYFYKNFKDFISYASGVNKNLKDEEYIQLKKAKDSNLKVTLKDKKTTINIVKNFFYKISPSIIRQIDFDVINGNIIFKQPEEMKGLSSRLYMENGNYKIEIASTNNIDESFALVREYANVYTGNLMNIEGIETGKKKVYIEVIASLTEFALAKHFSLNNALKNDSRTYILKKIYNSIYKMNDSYLTLTYLGLLLQNKSKEEIIRELGDEKIVSYLDKIIKNKKPCSDYINTLGTLTALKAANNTENIFVVVNDFFVKATTVGINYFRMPILLNENEAVNEIAYYIKTSL